MPIRILAAAVIVLVVASSSVRAEPLLQTLPEDGAWVAFLGSVDENGQKQSLTWTVKAVGKKDVSGVACRWIEMQVMEGEKNQIVIKCLVPESEFGKGKHPLGNAKQVFVKRGEEQSMEVANLLAADPPHALVLQGPGADAKKLDQKEAIETQTGKLECDVVTGTNQVEFGGLKLAMTARLLHSDKIPFSLAGAKLEFTITVNGNAQTVKAEMTFKESGKDAKSALPDVQ
jgi:hypothetical protein